jgi:hypothetical protein
MTRRRVVRSNLGKSLWTRRHAVWLAAHVALLTPGYLLGLEAMCTRPFSRSRRRFQAA